MMGEWTDERNRPHKEQCRLINKTKLPSHMSLPSSEILPGPLYSSYISARRAGGRQEELEEGREMSHSAEVFWAQHLGKDFSAPSRRSSVHPPASQKWAAKSVLLGGDHKTTGATGVVTGLSWFNPGAARPGSFTVAACSRGFPLLYHIPSRRAFTRAPISSRSPMAASAPHLVCMQPSALTHCVSASAPSSVCARSFHSPSLPRAHTACTSVQVLSVLRPAQMSPFQARPDAMNTIF